MVGAAGDVIEVCFDVRTCPLEREPVDPLCARKAGVVAKGIDERTLLRASGLSAASTA